MKYGSLDWPILCALLGTSNNRTAIKQVTTSQSKSRLRVAIELPLFAIVNQGTHQTASAEPPERDPIRQQNESEYG